MKIKMFFLRFLKLNKLKEFELKELFLLLKGA
jgi:hypothetical protein